jgi:hypothetical protein
LKKFSKQLQQKQRVDAAKHKNESGKTAHPPKHCKTDNRKPQSPHFAS